MKKNLLFISFAGVLIGLQGCASSAYVRQPQNPSASQTAPSVIQTEAPRQDPTQSKIDQRVEEISRERRSKYRLQSLIP